MEVNYKLQEPKVTIMIRNLPQTVNESEIIEQIEELNIKPKEIRIIRKKSTGVSRGFAFVEFYSIPDAKHWMQSKEGKLYFNDNCATMQYSTNQEALTQFHGIPARNDWYCSKCGTINFTRREACFHCNSPRWLKSNSDGIDEVSAYPTKKLILRNLDVLTKADDVLKAIETLSRNVVEKVTNILIERDIITSISRGICYLSFNNIENAINTYDFLNKLRPPFTIDKKIIIISFCAEKLEISNERSRPTVYTSSDIPKLAEYSAQIYATTTDEYDMYLKYYSDYYKSQIGTGTSFTLTKNQTDQVNSAAAVADLAIKRQRAKIQNVRETSQIPTGTDRVIYTYPDVSTFVYDSNSNYYYDCATGLYYNPTTQYFFNNVTNKFLYFDATQSTYKLAPSSVNFEYPDVSKIPNPKELSAPALLASKIEPEKMEKVVKVEKSDKADKVKIAKKISKDMEKWAKTLNQKKDNYTREIKNVKNSPQQFEKDVVLSDICYSLIRNTKSSPFSPLEINKKSVPEIEINTKSPETNTKSALAETIPNEKNVSSSKVGQFLKEASNNEVVNEIDLVHLTCLICKRKFSSQEILIKHTKVSTLHKENLTLLNGMTNKKVADYRDRAKERRLTTGGEPPIPNLQKEKFIKNSVVYTEKVEIPEVMTNIGTKMLQKMGWVEGQGLGRSNVQRNSIIELESRNGTAGLGIKRPGSSDNYKLYMKRMMLPRYNEERTIIARPESAQR